MCTGMWSFWNFDSVFAGRGTINFTLYYNFIFEKPAKYSSLIYRPDFTIGSPDMVISKSVVRPLSLARTSIDNRKPPGRENLCTLYVYDPSIKTRSIPPQKQLVSWMQEGFKCIFIILWEKQFCAQVSFVFHCFLTYSFVHKNVNTLS